MKFMRARDAAQAEALALLEAANWMIKNKATHIMVEGDCKSVIEAATSKFAYSKWQDHNILPDIS